MRKSIIETTSEKERAQIILTYLSGSTIKTISNNTGYSPVSVRKILDYHNVDIRTFADYKWIPSNSEKSDIIHLYCNEKRGIDFIATKYNVCWNTIQYWISNWNIQKQKRSELIKSNIEYYGPSSGFSGKTHSENTKKKMSKSQLNNKNRLFTTGPKSKYISTVIGNVQGSYEVAYLQRLYENKIPLPSIGSAVHTPYGSYIPDFSTDTDYIEIKSEFTWRVCQGLEINQKGIKSDIQYRKIKWVDKHVKPVRVIVMTELEVHSLFKKAISNRQLVLDNIVYKNGKYGKIENEISSS